MSENCQDRADIALRVFDLIYIVITVVQNPRLVRTIPRELWSFSVERRYSSRALDSRSSSLAALDDLPGLR